MDTVEDRFEFVADEAFDWAGAEMIDLSGTGIEPEDDIGHVDFNGPSPEEQAARRAKKNRVRDGIATLEDLDELEEKPRKGRRKSARLPEQDTEDSERGGRVTRPAQNPRPSLKRLHRKGPDSGFSGRLSTWLREVDERRARAAAARSLGDAVGASLAATGDARRALSGLHRPVRLDRKPSPKASRGADELFRAEPAAKAPDVLVGPPPPYTPPLGPARPALSSALAQEPCSCACHARTAVDVVQPALKGALARGASPRAACDAPADASSGAAGDAGRDLSEDEGLTLFRVLAPRKRRRRAHRNARAVPPDANDWKPGVDWPTGLGPLGPLLEWLPCSCQARDAEVCSHLHFGPRILACRVDTLHLSFFCSPRESFLEELEEKRVEAQADRNKKTTIVIGREKFTVHPHGAGQMYRFRLSHEFCDVAVSRSRSADVPAMRFELRAVFLAAAEVEGAWGFCREVVEALHEPIPHGRKCRTFLEPSPGAPMLVCDCGGPKPVRTVVTRADLAVDVIGAAFDEAKMEHFVMRARSRTRHKKQQGRADQVTRRGTQLELVSEDGEVEARATEPMLHIMGDGACVECDGTGRAEATAFSEHWSGFKVSGFSFGRSEISARIYDKTREIREQSRDKIWNFEPWAERGWVAGDKVWRVEVQLRRQGLKELCDKRTMKRLNIDTLEGFRAALSSIWTYCVGGAAGHTAWFKWTKPGAEKTRGAKRARWEVRDEWRAIQRAAWEREKPRPVLRQRRRDAKFHMLMAMKVGCEIALAAHAGKGLDGRYLTQEELLGPSREYLARKKQTWGDRVAEKAIEVDADTARTERTRWERDQEEHERVKAARAAQREVVPA